MRDWGEMKKGGVQGLIFRGHFHTQNHRTREAVHFQNKRSSFRSSDRIQAVVTSTYFRIYSPLIYF